MGIHAISAAAIDSIDIAAGEEKAVKIEITMNNSAGVFQVDDLLATKLRGTPLAEHVEVVASVEGRGREAPPRPSSASKPPRTSRNPSFCEGSGTFAVGRGRQGRYCVHRCCE